MFNTSKKTQELLTFLYQWQHNDVLTLIQTGDVKDSQLK